MKKIGILTFAFADNYGAVLQSYALKRYIESKGYQVSIIDYRPRKMYSIRTRIRKIFYNNMQENKFKAFRKKYLNISLKNNYDIVVVGSDQVWNPEIICFDKNWFEPRCQYNKIIAYAVSVGKERLSIREREFFLNNKERLNNYCAIGVRETSAKKLLETMDIKATVVCDPTFLLMNKIGEYDKIAKSSLINIQDEYILVYALEPSQKMDNILKKIKNRYAYNTIAIHPMNVCYCEVDNFVQNAGPEDFLKLVKNAKMVVTNSFHGLAFSLIYGKETISITHTLLGARQKQIYQLLDIGAEYLEEDVLRIRNNAEKANIKEMIFASERFIKKNILQ